MTNEIFDPLTEDEVRDVIETFWRLDAGKAHLADFIPIMDEGFVIRAVDEHGAEVARFEGLAGMEDHQDGKMDFFDEEFTLGSLTITQPGTAVIVHTTAVWSFRHRAPRAATSEWCVADLEHEWYLRRHPDRLTAVMTGHTCTKFAFRPGQAPSTPDARQAVKLSSESLHLDPAAMMTVTKT